MRATTPAITNSLHISSLRTIRISTSRGARHQAAPARSLFLLEAGDGASGDVDLHAVRDPQLNDVIRDPRDRPVDPSRRDDPIPVLEGFQHRLDRLLFLARG